MTTLHKLRLALSILRGDTVDETDRALQDVIAEMREIERRQIAARKRLQTATDAARLAWVTANRDNMARRPEDR